jgi:hypothetical protein
MMLSNYPVMEFSIPGHIDPVSRKDESILLFPFLSPHRPSASLSQLLHCHCHLNLCLTLSIPPSYLLLISFSSPSTINPSKAPIVNSSGLRGTMSELLLLLSPQSGHCDNASGLPMLHPGLWWSEKSNRDRYSEYLACQQFSF